MRARLQEQKIINKSKEPLHKSPLGKGKKPKMYSDMLKKKKNDSEFFDYEIVCISDYVYQGKFLKDKKHGEGIMILNNGVSVIGNWKQGLLEGEAVIITPFGGKVHANYSRGSLDGWIIVEHGNNFEISLFKNDKRDPVRTRYNQLDGFWTQSRHLPDGTLNQIIQMEKAHGYEMPSFLRHPTLVELYQKNILREEISVKTDKIMCKKINSDFSFYGYYDEEEIPKGLGVIYSARELYSGNFRSGSLDIHGLILFEDGLVYRGEIFGGKIFGNGLIYDPHLDETKAIQTSQDGIQKIKNEAEGFELQAFPFQMGKVASRITEDRGFGPGVQELCEQASKYYYREHSMPEQSISDLTQSEIKEENSHESHQDSLDFSTDNPRQFLQVPPEIPTPKSLPGQQIPTFQQILMKSIRPVQYPHLLEFEISKHSMLHNHQKVVSPKAHIGKIVTQGRRHGFPASYHY